MSAHSYKWGHMVRIPEVPAFEAIGWIPTDGFKDTHHGVWSVWMVYPHEVPVGEEPPVPDRELKHIAEAAASLGAE